MKRQDIKNGMKLILRNDDILYVVDGYVGRLKENTERGDIIVFEYELGFFPKLYREDLKYVGANNDYDIIEVRNTENKVLWKEEDMDYRDIKVGELVLVRDDNCHEWKVRKFVKYIYFEPNCDMFATLDKNMDSIEYWKQCKIYRK